MEIGSIINDSGKLTMGSKVNGVDVQKAMQEALKLTHDNKIKPYQDAIDAKTKEKAALTAFNNLVSDFYAKSQVLRNDLSGIGENVFNNRMPYVNISDGSEMLNNIIVYADSGNQWLGDFVLNISQLATRDSRASNTLSVADQDTPLNLHAGNLVINGQTVISVTASTTFNQLKTAINANQTCNVRAEVNAKTSDNNSFVLGLESQELATPIDFSGSDNTLLANLGLNGSPTAKTNLIAKFTYNGTGYERDTNEFTIDGSGVRIELKGSRSTDLKVSIDYDKEGVANAIYDWVESYNALRKEILTQKATVKNSDGYDVPTEDSMLFNDTYLEYTKRTFESILPNLVPGMSGSIKQLKNIGITYGKDSQNNNGVYTIDNEKFLGIDKVKVAQSIDNNFLEVKQLFGNFATSTNSLFSGKALPGNLSTSLIGHDITATLYNDAGTIKASFTRDGVTADAVVYDNYLLKGAEGSEYEGIIIGYDGTLPTPGQSFTSTLNFSQGLAQKTTYGAASYMEINSGGKTGFQRHMESLDTTLKNDETNKKRLTDEYQLDLKKLEEDGRLSNLFAVVERCDAINNILEQWMNVEK